MRYQAVRCKAIVIQAYFNKMQSCNTIQCNDVVLQWNAKQCNAMQYISLIQHNAIRYTAQQYSTTPCITSSTIHWNVIQCNAMEYIVGPYGRHTANNIIQCNAIQCNATHYEKTVKTMIRNTYNAMRQNTIWLSCQAISSRMRNGVEIIRSPIRGTCTHSAAWWWWLFSRMRGFW